MQFDETLDVAVCGFGHGGAISAITAADQGAITLILTAAARGIRAQYGMIVTV